MVDTGSKRQRNRDAEDFRGVGGGVFNLLRLAAIEAKSIPPDVLALPL